MSKILLADPNHSVRSAFSLLLRRRLPVTQVEEAADLDRLEQALQTAPPDVLLLDWHLVEASPTALERWQHQSPGLKIVVMSIHSDDQAPAIRAGASDFIDKGASPERALSRLRHCLVNPVFPAA